MNKYELMQERKALLNDCKTFLLERSGRELSTSEDKEYQEMEKKLSALSQSIKRLETLNHMTEEHKMNAIKPMPNAEAKTHKERERKEALLNAIRTRFKRIDNILQESVDESGGYLVPEELDKKLVDKLTDDNIVRKIADTIKTAGPHKINIAGAKPAATWVEEGKALTFGDATFDQISLDAFKLHVAVKVTEELLHDAAFDLEAYLIDSFSKALANAEEDAFLNGDGEKKPTGIFHATKGGEANVATKGASVTADDILTLIYTLKRPYRKNAAFIVNDETLAQLRALKDGNGTYIWQPSMQQGEPDRIFGYPVYTSQFCPKAQADKGFIAFGDFSYYKIGDRGARSFDELRELFVGEGMVGVVAKERVDGKLILREAVQILKLKAGR